MLSMLNVDVGAANTYPRHSYEDPFIIDLGNRNVPKLDSARRGHHRLKHTSKSLPPIVAE